MDFATSASSCSTIPLNDRDCRPALYLLLLIVLVATAGCGESSNDVSVEGKVTYRGEPVNKGSVTFFPSKRAPRPRRRSPMADSTRSSSRRASTRSR